MEANHVYVVWLGWHHRGGGWGPIAMHRRCKATEPERGRSWGVGPTLTTCTALTTLTIATIPIIRLTRLTVNMIVNGADCVFNARL